MRAAAGTSTIAPTSTSPAREPVCSPSESRASSEQSQGLAKLAGLADHGEHDGQRGVCRRLQGGAELDVQQLGPGQRQAQPADPQEGVLLRRLAQVGQGLVGAGVERAQHQAPAAEGRRRLRVGRALLVLAGRVRAAEEQELGAEEADAVGALGDGPRDVARRAGVGGHLDAAAVARDGRLAGALARGRGPALALGAPRLVGGARTSSPGATTTVPASPSSSSGVPSGTARMAGPRPATAGTPSARAMIAACEVGPPAAVAMPGDPLRVDRRRVGGAHLLGHQDGRLAAARLVGAGPGEALEHAPADVQEVGAPGAQVVVVERLVVAGGRPHGVVPGPRGGRSGRDGRLGRLHQRLVAQQQELGVEDVGRLGAGALGGGRPQGARGRPATASRAAARAARSSSGVPAGASGMGGAPPAARAGPAAWPGEAATPRSSSPGGRRGRRPSPHRVRRGRRQGRRRRPRRRGRRSSRRAPAASGPRAQDAHGVATQRPERRRAR